MAKVEIKHKEHKGDRFIDSEENHVLRAWSEFNGFAS
jgi:hypothetical protein